MAFINETYLWKKIFRDIEKATKKCFHLNGAIEFNKTCLTNGIFPMYCHIYIYICVFQYIYIYHILTKSFCRIIDRLLISLHLPLGYPWPLRQGGCLACWSCKIDSRLSWDCTDLYYARIAKVVLAH